MGNHKGLQIFVNLPAEHQLDAPDAYHLYRDQVTLIKRSGLAQRVAIDGTGLAMKPAPRRVP